MSIYIAGYLKDIKLPKKDEEPLILTIYSDGKVADEDNYIVGVAGDIDLGYSYLTELSKAVKVLESNPKLSSITMTLNKNKEEKK